VTTPEEWFKLDRERTLYRVTLTVLLAVIAGLLIFY
jgi:hypothetical protein